MSIAAVPQMCQGPYCTGCDQQEKPWREGCRHSMILRRPKKQTRRPAPKRTVKAHFYV